MLEELAKNHKTWINIAYKICNNKDYAKDLVQDMYLKLYNEQREVNAGYVYLTIKSIFLNQQRDYKEYTSDYIIDEIESEFDVENFCEIQIVDEVVSKQRPYKKIIVENAYDDGIVKFCKESKISYHMVKRTQQQLKEAVCQRKKQLGLL